MERRQFVRNAGTVALLGTATLAAGCTRLGGGTPLEVDTIDATSTTGGDVEVSTTIANPTENSQSATMTSQLDVTDGDTYTKEQDISVPPSDDNSYTITHELGMSESLSADRYEVTITLE